MPEARRRSRRKMSGLDHGRVLGCLLLGGAIILTACGQGSSDSGGVTQQERAIVCNTTSSGCICMEEVKSTTTSFECSTKTIPNSVCCAGQGFPSQSACGCHGPSETYKCWSYLLAGSARCKCEDTMPSGNDVSNVAEVSSCSPLPAEGGGVGTCCEKAGSYCFSSWLKGCGKDEVPVAVCKPPAPSCAPGYAEVSKCSM